MTRTRIDRRTFLAALAGLLAYPHSGRADDGDGRDSEGEDDHDEIRRALRAGLVRPLSEIAASVRDRVGGEVIDVQVEREGGRYIYELKVLQDSGRLREVYVDAGTGKILTSEDN
jgi:uncharacterized membrane protein YkoI